MTNTNTKEHVVPAGDKALVCMYNGKSGDKLDALGYWLFNQKVATSTNSFQAQTLPSTDAAAMYYSMRVFYQVQVWTRKTDINALHRGWPIHQGSFVPLLLQPRNW